MKRYRVHYTQFVKGGKNQETETMTVDLDAKDFEDITKRAYMYLMVMNVPGGEIFRIELLEVA